MNPHDFLAELYAFDPSLREHEAELLPVIERLLKHDPSSAPDPHFIATLRTQLLEHASTLSSSTLSPASLMEKFFYAFGGALATAIVIPLVYIGVMQQQATPTGTPLFGYNIQDKGSQAFGSLGDNDVIYPGISARPQSGGGGGGGGGMGMGGGGGAPATSIAMDSESMNYGTDAKMIAPFFIVQNEYVFDGTLPELTATVPVFKRQSSMASLPLSAISSRLNLGTLNLNSFGGMNIDSLSFAQNTPMGYQLYINLRDSSVNIDAQWEQWPQSKCTTDACWQAERVKLGDIPTDDVLMSIAKEFADVHGIDLSHYGEPEVNKAWKTEYDRTTDKANAYIPDSLQVVFPLMIDGKAVMDQQGSPTGINISVHTKQKKVMSVFGLMDRTYAKSDYPAVTDAAAVKTFLSRVDNYGPMPMDSLPKGTKVQTQKILLGEPTVGLSVYYSYQANKREELVIPSLIFPVKEVQSAVQGYYYRTAVVIPLEKAMFDQQLSGYGGGLGGGDVRPMVEPAMK